jgi:membrane protease YdiL (CAAX protease family)
MAADESGAAGEAAAGIRCYRHPDLAATAICVSCGRPVCKECSRFEGFRHYCPDCRPVPSGYYPYPQGPLPPPPPLQAAEPPDERERRWWMADWSIAEVVIALIAVFGIYNAVGVSVILSTSNEARSLIYGFVIYALLLCPLITLSAFLILRRHGRGLKELGIRWGRKGRTILSGLVGGIAALFASYAVYFVVVLLFELFTGRAPGTPESQNLQNLSGAGLVLAVFTTVVLAPIFEETFFRGLFYPALRRRMGVPLGILVSATVFGVLHVEALSLLSLIAVGALLAYVYERTDSLFAPMITHAFYNGIVILIALLSR